MSSRRKGSGAVTSLWGRGPARSLKQSPTLRRRGGGRVPAYGRSLTRSRPSPRPQGQGRRVRAAGAGRGAGGARRRRLPGRRGFPAEPVLPRAAGAAGGDLRPLSDVIAARRVRASQSSPGPAPSRLPCPPCPPRLPITSLHCPLPLPPGPAHLRPPPPWRILGSTSDLRP